METTVFNDLQTVYGGSLSREDFQHAVQSGLASIDFSQIISTLCKRIRAFTKIEQEVVEMRDPSDANGFLMDFSSFLNELECPYEQLVAVPLEERLATAENRLLALDFIIGEIQAAALNYAKHGPEERASKLSATAQDLKKIIKALGMSDPPADIDSAKLFVQLEIKLKAVLATIPPDQLGEPLLKTPLTKSQWDELERINSVMSAEYRLRREMLLKRFDVTFQSFTWSDKAKLQEANLKAAYEPRRKEMSIESKVTMADVLAARTDLLVIEKTSSHSVRKYTQSAINRVIMGHVPDRGGRTNESFPLGAEMPNFRPREQNGGGGGHRGGNRGGGRIQRGGHRGGSRGDGRW